MAGLSNTTLDDDDICSGVEIINAHKLKKIGSCLDLELDLNRSVKIDEGKLNSLFVEFLLLFYKQVYGDFIINPLSSSVLDNGKNVDLLKLFLVVRERGGYVVVSKSGLWQLVAKECGFDSSVVSKLKLVYFKYLDLLDRWLRRTERREDSGGEIVDKISYLISVAMGVGSGIKGLFREIVEKNKKDGDCYTEEVKSELVLKDNEKSCEEDCGGLELKGVMNSVDHKSVVEDHTGMESVSTGIHNATATNYLMSMDNFSAESVKENDFITESSTTEERDSNKKRKRENNLGLLKWISRVARDCSDQSVGSVPERSKWKSHGSEHVWKQALLVRESLFLKPAHPYWKDKLMHPAIFEDSVLGCSQRMDTSQRMASIESRKKLQRIFNVRMSCSGQDSEHLWFDDEKFSDKGSIQVGPEFQANVPEWNGETEESDPKWSGSRIWPIGTKGRNMHLIEREQIGKGRQDSCGCQFPGSSECVGFHISEKRDRVKLELGPAYYGWKFDQMGEEYTHLWTREEEKRFHDAVKTLPFSYGHRLFKELQKIFPEKNMASLVRYYFNVLILQRRANQNRTSPYDIDSDDERNKKISKDNIDNDDDKREKK
ncbi:hypothetical protein Leryth_006837 [Lithospermum erythrorhizon]|nr:hypothetical protein Leryth_006837 [Lithospermum erythrorhizon]